MYIRIRSYVAYLGVGKLQPRDGEHDLTSCEDYVHGRLKEEGDGVWRVCGRSPNTNLRKETSLLTSLKS